MNKDQAQRIIKDTFENKFDKAKFTRFIIELLNLKASTVNEPGVTFNKNSVPNAYQPFINSFEKITDYKSGEHKLDVLVIRLNRETSIERARTMQRNFIAWYLSGECDGEMKDAALAAFVSPDEEDWRFSFIKIDYSLAEDKKGRVKISEEFTPAKRWSFLVGSNEKSHTAQSQLIEILAKDEINPTLTQLEKAFNIETVTKEFFKKYKELFFWTMETLDEILTKDSKIRFDFEAKNINTIDFSKKLLGQIVFLYFLQKKGWFGVARDANWGTGPKNFLRELFEGKHGKYKNFYNDILELLFYDALRNDRSHNDDYYSNFNCKIPFLNGGLFDPINNYDWVHTDINLPNDLFSNLNKTQEGDTGTGILDIFDRYNFTVKEDEPLEKVVAVDPEMLGKVFENLLEVKDRKSKGTYYTPREIVHYMCQQSLMNYLATELEEKVQKDDIMILFKYGEQFGENNIDLEDNLKDIPESITKNAKSIDEKLANIKVCDPAVGSGAFLVGMMVEIVRTRNVLSNYIKVPYRNTYNFKRECIEKTLYGVDIDQGAVEIAKLRLWLSLVVEEEDIKKIKPLPNLDYKIVCGNSLLGVENNLFNYELFNELEKYKILLFNEISPNKKQEYKTHIDDLISQVTNGHKEFDFEIYFSEVFNVKKGFDIVIANPPYVSYGLRGGQKMAEPEKRFLRKNFPNSAEYKISLYAIFMDKAFQIARLDGGIQTLIVPDSFLLGRYFSKIRNLILKNNEIGSILLLPYSVFDATVGFSVVYCFQRKTVINNEHLVSSRFFKNKEQTISTDFKHLDYLQSYFERTKYNRFRLFFDKKIMDLVLKIENRTNELLNYMRGHTGVRSLIGQKNIVAKELKTKTWQKGLITGSQVLKYKISYDNDFINIDPKVLNKGGWDYKIIHNPKILLRQTGDSLIAAVDYDGYYHLNNLHSFSTINNKVDILFILSLLNSNLFDFYYKSISLEMNRTMAQTDIETIESLPIKEASNQEQKPFIEIVDKILAIMKDEDYLKNSEKQAKVKEYESQIDHMIYKLYGLTPEEIEIVENSIKKIKYSDLNI